MKNTLKISGSVITYVNFSKKYHFKVSDKCFLDFPVGKGKNNSCKFELICKVDTESLRNAETSGLTILDDFLSKLSIFFNVPIETLNIDYVNFDRNGLNVTTSEKRCEVKGAIATNITSINDFSKFLRKNTDNHVLNMFKRCRSENPYISYWIIYNIMQILVGEREDIDKYLKSIYPDLLILHNDFLDQDTTVFVAIRDSFSHKTTYSGKTLDIESELTSNISRFRDIARQTIIDKQKL